eukprot:CAMPEP_0177757500 /NCGR_PEP_ID=MMETSP0491_2-20121128/3676_1 /TAXON_ID=63592 /ORGANISM="Tetraselmis chuii, Strain PLY429" /LENGTH=100 /DNA_ID=CAMNT_0019273155 /DNA_START=224 /DNA_END=527 /DNA_ORIENTATION=-
MAGEHSADEGMEEAPARHPFPTFAAARHRHRPDSPLFDIGNLERELWAKQEAMRLSVAEREHLMRSVVKESHIPVQMTNRYPTYFMQPTTQAPSCAASPP